MNLIYWNMTPKTKVTRKWEVFAGRNKFYCDGYLMSAPNTGVFYLTVFLTTGTSVLFFAFDCPFLTIQITPGIPIIGAFLYFFTMGSLLRTTFTDPGVIPRASHDEAAYIEKQIEVPNSLNSPTYRPPPRTKEVLVRGQTVKLKYCFTCKIFRPPRASHCSLCDNCVDRFDHHCPWVGNCVGKRNYRFFYMFIVSLAFLAVFIFSCSLTHLILLAKNSDEEFLNIVKQAPFSVVVTFICFFSIWSVIGLAGFHTYLTTSDQTTNEDIKGSFSSKGAQQTINPYSQRNICMNCFYILCGPMTPSLIDRRGIGTDEYKILMQPVRHSNTIPSSNQPIGSTEHIHKLNFYDIELEPNLINSGVYRQQSYDNFEKGHSNSIAQLVENELPISSLNNSVEDEISPNDHMENISQFINLSGSYSNLFREKIGNDEIINNSNTIIEHMPNDKIENVYSNIPQTSLKLDQSSSENSDPNLHVYSNICRASSPQLLNPKDNDMVDFKTDGSISLLTNDLDLDDPVIVAGTFCSIEKSAKPTNDTFHFNSTKSNLTHVIITNEIPPNKLGAIEMKNLMPEISVLKSTNPLNMIGSYSVENDDNSNSFCSAGHMRLLHDTTMIDTALDLDSLDGSSLGNLDGSTLENNTQLCFVKTAIY